eukprot:scpid11208/ scgid3347/ DNA polymerase alpha catalytic subunit; DNA polymerase alpha catalytic subunit p180
MEDDDSNDGSLAMRRGRRSRGNEASDKRKSQLQKIRDAKQYGIRSEMEVGEKEDVYDLVDEKEYQAVVRKRQEDDFVIGADAEGYNDTGREIFEEEQEEPAEAPSSSSSTSKGGFGSHRSTKPQRTKRSASVLSMFKQNAAKRPKKEENVSLDGDNLLNDILMEVKTAPAPIHTPSRSRPAGGTPMSGTPMSGTPSRIGRGVRPRHMSLPHSAGGANLSSLSPNYDTPQLSGGGSSSIAQATSASPASFASPELPRSVHRHPTAAAASNGSAATSQAKAGDSNGASFTNGDVNDGFGDIAMDMDGFADMVDDDWGVETDQGSTANGASPTLPSHANGSAEPAKPKMKDEDIPMESTKEDGVAFAGMATEEPTHSMSVDSSDVTFTDLTHDVDGVSALQFYWIDLYEEAREKPGSVHVFGKAPRQDKKTGRTTFVSCCMHVNNIERKMYFLPRAKKLDKNGQETDEDVTIMDVYQEFNDIVSTKYKIMRYLSKKVTKKYCFDIPGIPASSDYLEIKYSFSYPALPADLSGRTFSRVFGTSTSCLERFVLDQKLKGPCWLQINEPKKPHAASSWCKVEVLVDKPDEVLLVPDHLARTPPPVVVMSMRMRTMINPKSKSHEIMAICCRMHYNIPLTKPVKTKDKVNIDMSSFAASGKKSDEPAYDTPTDDFFCVVSKPSDQQYPKEFMNKVDRRVEKTSSERGLLNFFLAKIANIDPDVIVGHDFTSFDLDILLHRLRTHKVSFWSKLSRLQRKEIPRKQSGGSNMFTCRSATAGRLVCDVKTSCAELIHCRSYDLASLSNVVLSKPYEPMALTDVPLCYVNSRGIYKLIDQTLGEATYALFIMYNLNVLPLSLQITRLAGNVLSRTLQGGRSERNEFLLLHAFTERDYICPDKAPYSKGRQPAMDATLGMDDDEAVAADAAASAGNKKGRRKPQYSGGLVLDPKRGFYDKFILLLDFNSLYPSLIREYNICFTTVETKFDTSAEGEDDIPCLPASDLDQGVLPAQIAILVDRRREVKNEMKRAAAGSDLYAQLDVRQKALKLTANSMYGCLGFAQSRFRAKHLAALVTFKGRETLARTKELVEQMGLEVVYGDTDSIMINTNSRNFEDVHKLGNKVKAEVNKLYTCLQIDIDGIFKSMLLLNKKKYAAVTIQQKPDGTFSEHREEKGLETVRRDWCNLAKKAGVDVMEKIFSVALENLLEEVPTYLANLRENIKTYPLDQFVITKNLKKEAFEYNDAKSLAHVLVALRLAKAKTHHFGAGDTVPYVICEDGSSNSAMQRAYHPDELRKNSDLTIDYKYYLKDQVHPVVSRLCEPVDSLDAAMVAEYLGLDRSAYRKAAAAVEEDENDLALGFTTDSEILFKDAQQLEVPCPSCSVPCKVEGLLQSDSAKMAIPKCAQCSENLKLPYLGNRLLTEMQSFIQTYYEGWLMCADAACSHRTRSVPLTVMQGHPACPLCRKANLKPEYTDTMLYNQLLYYSRLFDVDWFRKSKKKGQGEVLDVPFQGMCESLHRVAALFLEQSGYSVVDLGQLFAPLRL